MLKSNFPLRIVVDRITRKDLKHDKFAEEVTHTVEYVGHHRKDMVKYGVIVLVVLVLGIGTWMYRTRTAAERQSALTQAMRVQGAAIGPNSGNPLILTFPTQAEKDQATIKAFSEFIAKYSSSDEAYTARYYMGVIAADAGKMADAEKSFQEVAKSGPSALASLAKLALAQIYQSESKTADAEKLLRGLMENPTAVVSKEQATISLARLLAPTNAAEARKLLEPLREGRSPVSRAALTLLSELPK
jgi:predicted negative regulator of RcsB-dependent stress response